MKHIDKWIKTTELFIKDEIKDTCGFTKVNVITEIYNDIDKKYVINTFDNTIGEIKEGDYIITYEIKFEMLNGEIFNINMKNVDKEKMIRIIDLIEVLDCPIDYKSGINEVKEEEYFINRYLVAKGGLYVLLFELFKQHKDNEKFDFDGLSVKVDSIIYHSSNITVKYLEE